MRYGFDPLVGEIPWRRKWQPTLVFFPGKSHGQGGLVGYSPWGHRVRQDLVMKQQQRSSIYFFPWPKSFILSPTHRDYVPPSIQEPLVTPISLRIKSKPLPCFTEPFEGWPSGSSNLISLITPLSSTNGLATVPWINPFLSIAVRALSCKQQNPHWLEQEGHSVKDFGKLVDYQRE